MADCQAADFVFVMDTSSSIGDAGEVVFQRHKQLIVDLTSELKLEGESPIHRCAFLSYSGEYTKLLPRKFDDFKSVEEFHEFVLNVRPIRKTTLTARALSE